MSGRHRAATPRKHSHRRNEDHFFGSVTVSTRFAVTCSRTCFTPLGHDSSTPIHGSCASQAEVHAVVARRGVADARRHLIGLTPDVDQGADALAVTRLANQPERQPAVGAAADVVKELRLDRPAR